jgi:hypothetical protein
MIVLGKLSEIMLVVFAEKIVHMMEEEYILQTVTPLVLSVVIKQVVYVENMLVLIVAVRNYTSLIVTQQEKLVAKTQAEFVGVMLEKMMMVAIHTSIIVIILEISVVGDLVVFAVMMQVDNYIL